MPKADFTICRVDKSAASAILDKYHYLKDESKGFKVGYNYGLLFKGTLVGVCIFTTLSVPEIAKGAFGLARNEQDGLFELSRLCLTPDVQATEHNLASWFVSRCLKALKQDTEVRAVLSYADSRYHEGIVYRACNFKYYGLTDKKKDFWILQEDGSYKKHSRGKMSHLEGEWRDRSRKHRYLMVFDKELEVLWETI